MRELSHQELRHIYLEIANGRGQHGSFLRSFAEAYLRADPEDQKYLYKTACLFVEKYSLDRYLSNFEETA
jgi:hypothetical protein